MDKGKLLNQFNQLLNEIELKEQTTESFYDFEKFCVEHLQKMSREVVTQAIGEQNRDYRKKKR